jgi:hypothetical protein
VDFVGEVSQKLRHASPNRPTKGQRGHTHSDCRCFELIKLRRQHIGISDPVAVNHVLKRYLAGEALVLSDLLVSFEIHLRNRKGWQRKVDKGQTESDLRGTCTNATGGRERMDANQYQHTVTH